MKTIKIISIALISIFFFSARAWPEEVEQKPDQPWLPCCMRMMKEMGPSEQTRGAMSGMMKQSDMPQEMMRRWEVMMRTPIYLDSPCALYGQADSLGLSKEQEKKLQEIEDEARAKAQAVLTTEQRKKLGEIPDTPVAMMQMCQQMRAKMMSMAPNTGDGCAAGKAMMMCPMMKKMHRGSAPEGASTNQKDM